MTKTNSLFNKLNFPYLCLRLLSLNCPKLSDVMLTTARQRLVPEKQSYSQDGSFITITHPVPDKAVEIAQGDFRDDSLSAVFNLLSFNTWVIMNQAGASKQSLVMEQAGTLFFFWMVIHSAFLIPVKVLMQMTVSPERKHLEELRCFIVVRVCSILSIFKW